MADKDFGGRKMLTIKINDKEFEITEGFATVGAGEDADIRIKETGVQPIHAEFEVTRSRIIL